ncbi:PfkB family carbohydrate kinase [Sphingomonas sp. S2-65]|uniref:PfkB family carbohydrate kinase n=1 Tax=Sphingomonas sp. S2-65 TaxID=2903960 RepID=UPI001F401C45|nr:PfkB family carbohydrate kinase [Sphingomonas sp. S2-65]UYY60346.1 PfkB family carbohydrate kinase [Sphingomonas sp. S2-65]
MPLAQADRLHLHVGGAEANVAGALASLGHAAGMVSALPDQALGEAALRALRAACCVLRASIPVGSGRVRGGRDCIS